MCVRCQLFIYRYTYEWRKYARALHYLGQRLRRKLNTYIFIASVVLTARRKLVKLPLTSSPDLFVWQKLFPPPVLTSPQVHRLRPSGSSVRWPCPVPAPLPPPLKSQPRAQVALAVSRLWWNQPHVPLSLSRHGHFRHFLNSSQSDSLSSTFQASLPHSPLPLSIFFPLFCELTHTHMLTYTHIYTYLRVYIYTHRA